MTGSGSEYQATYKLALQLCHK